MNNEVTCCHITAFVFGIVPNIGGTFEIWIAWSVTATKSSTNNIILGVKVHKELIYRVKNINVMDEILICIVIVIKLEKISLRKFDN